jgi:ribonuclease D
MASSPSSPSPRKNRWLHGRSAHRQRSHDESHAGAAEKSLPEVLVHPMVPQGEPAIITTQAALDDHLAAMRAAGRFAYDTEFIGEHTYHAHLCVIQTATPQIVTIIDPLAMQLDLRGLWELLADPSVEKIVHAGEQDLEPVLRHIGRPPANVIDTQILAAFAGYGYPTGQARLLRDLLGADPGHGLTFSQWDRRPLTHVQLLYAANDVRYLPLLYQTLAEKAQELGNLAWGREECQSLCCPARYQFDPSAARLRVRGAETLEPRELAILTHLVAWREHAAETQDIPPRSLVRDPILMAMAKYPAKTVADLDLISGLPRPVETRWGADIVQATAAGLAATLPNAQPYVHVDRWEHRKKIDAIWQRLQQACATRSIDPAIVASKREIGQFIRASAAGTDRERAAGRLARCWRGDLLRDVLSCDTEDAA